MQELISKFRKLVDLYKDAGITLGFQNHTHFDKGDKERYTVYLTDDDKTWTVLFSFGKSSIEYVSWTDEVRISYNLTQNIEELEDIISRGENYYVTEMNIKLNTHHMSKH